MFYIFIFLVVWLAGIGVLPIPEEIIVLSAGVGIEQGVGKLFLTFIVVFISLITSDYFLFWVGKKFGMKILKIKIISMVISQGKIDKVQNFFDGHNKKLIFFGRFVSGLRSISFFSAGMSQVKPAVFLWIDTLASLIYIPVLLFLGYRFSYDIARITDGMTKTYHAIEVVIIVSIIVWFFFALSKKILNNGNAQSESLTNAKKSAKMRGRKIKNKERREV